jgi:hypothetical protein
MTYEVVLTKDAENDLDNFIQYLLFENIVNRLQQMFFRTLRIRKEVWKKLLQV